MENTWQAGILGPRKRSVRTADVHDIGLVFVDRPERRTQQDREKNPSRSSSFSCLSLNLYTVCFFFIIWMQGVGRQVP